MCWKEGDGGLAAGAGKADSSQTISLQTLVLYHDDKLAVELSEGTSADASCTSRRTADTSAVCPRDGPRALLCSMVFSPNDSPLAGREGSHLTGSKIGERLHAEAETSVSLRVLSAGGGGESFEVQARGELQLGLLMGAPPPPPIILIGRPFHHAHDPHAHADARLVSRC